MADVINAKGGCIILLDVPSGSSITLDSVTRITPSSSSVSAASTSSSTHQHKVGAPATPFHRGLWIINNISTTSAAADNDFHLLVVRSSSSKDNTNTSCGGGDGCRTLPVGFVVSKDTTTNNVADELGYQWMLARRYDQHTEEISNEVMNELSMRNIIMAMEEGGELHRFVISYDQFMGGSSNHNTLPPWDKRTSLINSQFLQQCHGIESGDKIVPSSDGQDTNNTNLKNDNNEVDGKSISYPPIPCIDTTINARQLAQHSGTRKYLSKLSPEKRTWLLFNAKSSDDAAQSGGNPGEYIWSDILCQYYGRNKDHDSSSGTKSEQNFLADIELSFHLFLFLECHASLEHWRDTISMCALSIDPTNNTMVIQHPQFFQKLLIILYNQLSCIEMDFFQDVEYSSGEDNFMVRALRRFCPACECDVGKRKRDGGTVTESLKGASRKLRQLVHDKFGIELSVQYDNIDNDDDDDDEMETDALWSTIGDDYDENKVAEKTGYCQEMDNHDDDEDEPIMIPYDQIEASLARSDASKKLSDKFSFGRQTGQHNKEYPLLYAAMTPDEDEVMACARIIDEAKDVSLVRIAAAYLEEVEAHRGNMF